MNKFITRFLILFLILTNQLIAKENIMILKLKDGDLKIELFDDVAPNHVKRIKQLAQEGKYDGVVFHRVIPDFMAQSGDVQFGNSNSESLCKGSANGLFKRQAPNTKRQAPAVSYDFPVSCSNHKAEVKMRQCDGCRV